MKISTILWSVLIGLICSQSASALLVNPDPSWMSTTIACDNIPVTETDWIAGETPGVNPIEIPLFDPSLGVLKQVDITVENCVYQTAGFENRAITFDTFSTETGAEIYTTLLDGSTQIISIVKEGPIWHTLPPYDGVVDYAGPSGFDYILDRCGTEGHSVLAQADLAAYIGAGETRELPTEAIGYTALRSAGNINAQVLTSAGAKVCVTYYYVPCDDGIFCNGVETSNGVTCQPGTPVNCDDGIACTADSCNEAADRCDNIADDSKCDDGLYCNGAETCDPVAGCQDGADPVIDDGVACTDDACDETNDVVTHTPNNGFCSNNDVCDGIETCDPAAGCQPGTPLTCDNGLFCDGQETCNPVAGCQDGADPVIDDGVACTDDSCDEENNVVVHRPNDGYCSDNDVCDGIETCDPVAGCQDGTPLTCDNGLFCDGLETCDAVAGCQDGADPVIDDGVDCTDDSCDEENNVVVHTPNDGYCSNNDVCDGIETCDPVAGCQDGTPLTCDNGLFCDGLETCDAVAGCQDGADPVIDDGVDCTDDSCDEENNVVVHTPNNGYCSDNDVCNGIETCDAVNDCQAGTPLVCDDGNSCTEDSCDPIDGCIYTSMVCDDGNDCTTDACVNGVCVYTAIVCNDNNPCTTDACVDGECVYTPITNCNCAPVCPWVLKNELYVASCKEVKEVSASEGLLANDNKAVEVLDPELITIDPKYGTIEVHADGSFIYDPTEATSLYNGIYVQIKYKATNGYCEAKYPGIAKIQVRCK